MTDCSYCGASGLEWHENLRCYVNAITGQKHGKDYCAPKEIPLYMKDYNGTLWARSWDRIRHELTNDAVRLGLDPWNYREERRGNFIQVKR